VYTSCSTNCNAPGAISRVTTSLWNLVKARSIWCYLAPNVNNIATGPRFHASVSHTLSLSFMFRVCAPVVMWLCPLRVTFMTVIDCTSLLFFVCLSCSWCHSVTLLLCLSHYSCQCGYNFLSLSLIHCHHVTLIFLYLHHVCQGSLIVRTWLQFPPCVTVTGTFACHGNHDVHLCSGKKKMSNIGQPFIRNNIHRHIAITNTRLVSIPFPRRLFVSPSKLLAY